MAGALALGLVAGGYGVASAASGAAASSAATTTTATTHDDAVKVGLRWAAE